MGQPILARARDLFGKYRKRIATLVLFVGLAIVGVKMSEGVPRDLRVSVPLGDDHATGSVTQNTLGVDVVVNNDAQWGLALASSDRIVIQAAARASGATRTDTDWVVIRRL